MFSEYIVASFIASLIAGIGEKIAPGKMKKYVTFVASLVLLIYLASPIQSLGEELLLLSDNILKNEEEPSSPSVTYDEVLTLSERKTAEAIEKHLFEKYEIKGIGSVSVDLKMEESGTVLITHISLEIDKVYSNLVDDMEAYLEKTFQTETSVTLSGE